jgi:hypothetical protein
MLQAGERRLLLVAALGEMRLQAVKSDATGRGSDVAIRTGLLIPRASTLTWLFQVLCSLYQRSDKAQQLLILGSTVAPRQEIPEVEVFYLPPGRGVRDVHD